MPFDFDTSNPIDTYLIPSYPGNERAFRTAVAASVDIEHDHTTGRHAFGIGADAARDAITDWGVGSLWINTGESPAYLQRVVSIGPVVWENVDSRAASVAHLDEQNDYQKTQWSTFAEVTPGAGSPQTLALDLTLGSYKYATIVADTRIQLPTGSVASAGTTIQLEIIQDGTGGWTVDFVAPGGSADFVSAGGLDPVIATVANGRTMLWITRQQDGDWLVSSSPNSTAF